MGGMAEVIFGARFDCSVLRRALPRTHSAGSLYSLAGEYCVDAWESEK